MTPPTPHTIDLDRVRLRVARDVLVWPIRERDQVHYHLEIPALHRFHRTGYRETVLMSLLDGTRTLPQACSIAASRLGKDAPTSEQTKTIAKWLLENRIVHPADSPPPDRQKEHRREIPSDDLGHDNLNSPKPNQQPASAATRKPGSGFNPFWIKTPLPISGRRAARWTDRLTRVLSPLLSPAMVSIGCLSIVVAIVLFFVYRSQLKTETIEIFHPDRWWWMLTVWVLLKVVHELAHAVACHRKGGRVGECGVVWVLMTPLAYVDVSSCWRMTSRWDRIAVAAAGMFVECVIASVALMVWVGSEDLLVRSVCRDVVCVAGISTLLFNANVLMRFDGYFILADLIGIPNLAGQGSAALTRLAKCKLFGEVESGGQSQLTRWRSGFVIVYAVAALMWRVAVCVTLVIAASTLFAGGGIVLSVVGIVLWTRGPLTRLRAYLVAVWRDAPIRAARGVAIGLAGCGILIAGIFGMPIPSPIDAPVIARYQATTQVHAPGAGFIKRVFVRDGQVVERGDILIEIDDDELRHAVADLELQREITEAKLRQASGENDEGNRQVLRKHLRTIESQWQPMIERLDSMTITAKRSGRVVSKNLHQSVGTFVDEGDVLMWVAGDADKEWVALVSPEQFRRVSEKIGLPVQVRTSDHRVFVSPVQRMEPRASNRLSHPALASVNGGPLPVLRDSGDADSDLRLTSPHFQVWIRVPEAGQSVPAGMTLRASFGAQNRTAAERLRRWLRGLSDPESPKAL